MNCWTEKQSVCLDVMQGCLLLNVGVRAAISNSFQTICKRMEDVCWNEEGVVAEAEILSLF